MALQRWTAAQTALDNAHRIAEELDIAPLLLSAWEGLARYHLARGPLEQAKEYANLILDYLDSEDSAQPDVEDRLMILLTCYQVLHASREPRAPDVLERAHTLLQERAAKISKEEWRRSFLHNVPWNREIISLFKLMKGE